MRKYMNCIALLLLFFCMSLTSCGVSIEKRGLENFSVADSSVSLCQNIIPKGFIDLFSFESGDYCYSSNEKAPGFASCDRVILYFYYPDEVYFSAKQYAMEHLDLSEEPIIVYHDYYFYHNETPANDESNHIKEEDYPYELLRFAYHDEKHCLVFLGFSVSVELHQEVDQVADDWGAFLEKYYGDFYTFS